MNRNDSGAARAGAELSRLLAQVPAYRRRWEAVARSSAPGRDLSYAAVSRVVADYLFELAEDDAPMPRAIRDRVRRALRGDVLEPVTLRWFVHAFSMSAADAEHLVALRNDIADLDGWPTPWRQLPQGGYRTRSLHEFHDVGPQRLPVRHRTVQVIESEEDGLVVYPYRFDTPDAVVVVDEGGTAGPVYRVGDDVWCTNIALNRPLARAATTSIVYETRFSYDSVPAPEFRRATRRRIDSLGVRVRFDPRTLPSAVWWGRWDLDGAPLDQEEVTLDDGVAHRFGAVPDATIVGFRWQW